MCATFACSTLDQYDFGLAPQTNKHILSYIKVDELPDPLYKSLCSWFLNSSSEVSNVKDLHLLEL